MLVWLASALLAVGASAADAPKPKAKAPVKAAAPAVAASTAAFAWASTAPLTVEAVLAHYEAMDAALVSLSARFEQSMTMKETGVTSRVEGTLAYKKPDRLRIEHVRPEPQVVVADGKDIWIHRTERKQVVQAALSDWKNADPAIGNLMEFGSYSRMLKTYDVTLDTASARAALLLRPKAGAAARELTLRLTLSSATLFPETTELTVGSLNVRTAFAELAFNPVLDDKAFLFTPPADADVFRDFKPPKFEP
ncbi:MAG: outer membrane lipoprotein carrier protein [Elusimicrobia bacterium]|nr:MAG: outer membrane lipoprotein carrier protein [Elusimicrobiota bacterium]